MASARGVAVSRSSAPVIVTVRGDGRTVIQLIHRVSRGRSGTTRGHGTRGIGCGLGLVVGRQPHSSGISLPRVWQKGDMVGDYYGAGMNGGKVTFTTSVVLTI